MRRKLSIHTQLDEVKCFFKKQIAMEETVKEIIVML